MWGQEWKWETSEKTILEVQTGDGGVEEWPGHGTRFRTNCPLDGLAIGAKKKSGQLLA